MTKTMVLITLAFGAALSASAANAQMRDAPADRTTGMTESAGQSRDAARAGNMPVGSRPANSTNRLENGTASGKGSGPGGGSPNGN